MKMSVQCPSCLAALKISHEYAGKKGKCPKCNHSFQIQPLESEESSIKLTSQTPLVREDTRNAKRPPDLAVEKVNIPNLPINRVSAEKIVSGKRTRRSSSHLSVPTPEIPTERTPINTLIDGQIKRVRKSPTYLIAILLVTICMVLLPMIYMGLIFVVGWGVYYHLFNHAFMLNYGSGRGKLFFILAYVSPLVIGVIMVLFMIKPLLARPSRRVSSRSLDRKFQPLLFEFVEAICQIVGAPRPKRIDVDYHINASASFRRGMRSFFGTYLVLTIGIPLTAHLSLRQFAGIMAHEFGHFGQGTGMRLSYLARTINDWFKRIVYQRDEWDDWLSTTADDVDFRIGWMLYLSMICVWISRNLLWLLMMVGHILCGYLLRQMEYDADRYQTRLAGTKSLIQAMQKIPELSIGWELAFRFINDHIRHDVYPDDISKIIPHVWGKVPLADRKKIKRGFLEQKTSVFSSHPSVADRIAQSERENAEGLFIADLPATVLFQDFDSLSRNMTYYLYTSMGLDLSPHEMTPMADVFQSPSLPTAEI